MKHRKDDLLGIRKARFASFVLLLICFAAMLVIIVLAAEKEQAYIASTVTIAALVASWWFVYRNILYREAAFFGSLATEVRDVHHRLRMLESAVRQIGDGVVIVADDGDFVLVNETAKRLITAFDGDLDGPRYDEYASGFSEKLERAAILEAAQENRATELISVGGQFYKIGYVSLIPEKDQGQSAVAVISDVTEYTNVENMQSEFIANVSHELKTPLASVRGYAETLMNDAVDDPETLHEFLGIIVTEADRMDRLVKGILSLARLDYTDTAIDATESDLPSLVKVSMKKLDVVASKKFQTVNQMFADKLRVNVEMDRDLIEQVILNVLGNAIKYTGEEGRIDVDIILGQNCVQIVISDNGVGIPEEDIARVFERFRRVEKSRSGETGGTGLGLAISKKIVDAHGGTIGVESKFGRGTTVTISLPLGKSRGTPGILQ